MLIQRSVLGCLRKVGCVFSVKKVWGMKLHFMKEKGSRSDIQVTVSGQENEVMGTESEKKFLWKVGPQEKSFVHKYKFSWDVELPLIMDFKFLYLGSDLFCLPLKSSLLLWLSENIVSQWSIWFYLTVINPCDTYQQSFLNNLTSS